MFDNKFTKRDALTESVKQVMLENEIRRQVEFTLNEQLGIHSKNALPHEQHAQYDAMLNEAIKDALSEGMWPKKNMAEEDARAKSFAALAPPRDKATQKDRLVGAGVLKPHPTNPNKHVLAKEESLDEVRDFGTERQKITRKIRMKKYRDASEESSGTPMIDTTKKEFTLTPIAKNYIKRSKQLGTADRYLEKAEARMQKKQMQKEAVNPYAVGMSAAMKSTGDKPPLEKSTIKKAHKIAKKVQTNESLESILEEIAYNLQEQFVNIYENGNYDMMNDFLGSLTEEQAELLGLNEQETDKPEPKIRDATPEELARPSSGVRMPRRSELPDRPVAPPASAPEASPAPAPEASPVPAPEAERSTGPSNIPLGPNSSRSRPLTRNIPNQPFSGGRGVVTRVGPNIAQDPNAAKPGETFTAPARVTAPARAPAAPAVPAPAAPARAAPPPAARQPAARQPAARQSSRGGSFAGQPSWAQKAFNPDTGG